MHRNQSVELQKVINSNTVLTINHYWLLALSWGGFELGPHLGLVVEDVVAVGECSPLHVLARQPHVCPLLHQRPEGHRLAHRPVHGAGAEHVAITVQYTTVQYTTVQYSTV